MQDTALIAAGALAVTGAAVHGVGGELLVVRRLALEKLPSSRFGGPRMTQTMIHATWHMTSLAFLTVGCALLLAGSVLDGDTARGVGLLAAAEFTAFALVGMVLGGAARSPAALFRHPGPAVLSAAAALAWWGAL
jgi:hypothetical protein